MSYNESSSHLAPATRGTGVSWPNVERFVSVISSMVNLTLPVQIERENIIDQHSLQAVSSWDQVSIPIPINCGWET